MARNEAMQISAQKLNRVLTRIAACCKLLVHVATVLSSDGSVVRRFRGPNVLSSEVGGSIFQLLYIPTVLWIEI